MTDANVLHAAFNRGRISRFVQGRDDIEGSRIRLGADVCTNIIPRVLGSAMLAPGWAYINGTKDNARAYNLPFRKKASDTAILEFTTGAMRVKVNEQPVTRVAVSTAIQNTGFLAYVTNGTFATDTAWTKGAGWSIAAGVASATLSSAALSQNSAVTLVAGKSYSITYTITRSAGSVVPSIGGTAGTSRSSSATFTETIIAGATQVLAFTGTGFSGTVDAVSIEPLDTGWIDTDEGSAASTVTGGQISLTGTGFSAAIRKQEVAVAGGDINKEHALRVTVARGPVTIRVGSTDGGDEYVTEAALGVGVHSLTFTPTGNFYIRLQATRQYAALVSGCTIEGAGVLSLTLPYTLADLPYLRWTQSEDVVYLACTGYQQLKIERRGNTTSWAVVNFEPEDGPFRVVNTGITRLSSSAINGDVTLTASRSFFKSTHVGALFQLTSIGQAVNAAISGADQWSDPIRVIGTSTGRTFDIAITGTWSGTVRLQRSVDAPGAWVDVSGQSWTVNATPSYFDALNNQIIYYRIGIKAGEYTSGTANVALTYAAGGITGVVKVTAYTNETTVSGIVLKALGGMDATANWREGEWSTRRGWPDEVKIDGGRLCWIGKGKTILSISDAYDSYDPDYEGDAGPINRSIPASNSERVNWALSLERLCFGTDGGEFVVRSSSLDEPLTPTLFNPKSPSDRGSANVPAVKDGTSGYFVGAAGVKLIELAFGAENTSDYSTTNGDLCQLVPEIGLAGFTRIAVQQNPDKRFHCLRADGTAAILLKDPSEDVLCWVEIETDGDIEDVLVMPGDVEDKVYYWVKRTNDGGDIRCMERWALESECQGVDGVSKLAHSFIEYDGAATATITGLDHHEGKDVVVWADGIDYSPLDEDREPTTFTVSGGAITLPDTVENAIVGLFYRGRFKSSKLMYAGRLGSALLQRKRVSTVGLVLADVHYKGLYYGPDFTRMDPLPEVHLGAPVEDDSIMTEREVDMTEFPGDWGTDSRICFEMSAPRPCTLQGMVFGIDTNDKG
jgi:hypothetical protein